MKKLFLICLCLSLGAALKAQGTDPDYREKFAFGIKAGLNYSDVWDEKGQDFKADPRPGFAGGIFFGIPLGRFLGIQPEILISQKGFKGTGTLLESPYSYTRRTTYIDFPLQVQVKPTRFLTLLVGPQYSYLVQEKNVFESGAYSFEQEMEFNNDINRKGMLGFVGGVDVIISHVVVSGRLGADVIPNQAKTTSSTPRYKNNWGQLTVGFKL